MVEAVVLEPVKLRDKEVSVVVRAMRTLEVIGQRAFVEVPVVRASAGIVGGQAGVPALRRRMAMSDGPGAARVYVGRAVVMTDGPGAEMVCVGRAVVMVDGPGAERVYVGRAAVMADARGVANA